MDPSDPQRLWAGGSALWRTGNGAASWLAASAPLGGISAVAVAPTDSNVVVAGNTSGTIFRSERAMMTNSAASWTQSRPRTGFVSWLAFDPASRNIVYATYSTFGSTHVWRSVDGGITWSGIDGFGATGLPDVPVNCLVVDPNNSARLYVGTDLGVFVSLDGGNTWAVENTGFANVNVAALSIINADGQSQLFAFTHGRGAWRISLGPASCSHRLSAAGRTFSMDGGNGSVAVTPVTGSCNRTATSNADWITLTSGSSGSGSGTVSYTVAPNPGGSERIGAITIAGRSYAVTQAGRINAALDTFAPVIRITAPTTTNSYQTESAVISLSGTASDNVGVIEVTWANQRGGSGTANGTSAWTISVMPLLSGINPITVTARDERGNTSSTAINILRTSSTSAPVPSVITLAGGPLSVYAPDGSVANPLRLGDPVRIATDAAGNVYIADRVNLRLCRFSPVTGATTVIAGYKPIARPDSVIGDGGPAINARVRYCYGLTAVGNGDLYFCDAFARTVRKISASTSAVTKVAGLGDGLENPIGDGGPALSARLSFPTGLAFDAAGNLYIAGGWRARRVSATTGIIETVAGGGPASPGDGSPATLALLSLHHNLAFDPAGNLLFAHSNRVRRVVPFSIPDSEPPRVTIPGGQSKDTVQLCCGSLRGNVSDNYSVAYLTWSANRPVGANFRPDLGAGTFELDLFRLLPGPTMITFTAWDGAGNTGSTSIELDYQPPALPRPGRIVSGGRGSGFSGDEAQSNEAQLWSPEAVAADVSGNLYVADTGNHRVRRISPDGVITTFAGNGQLGYSGDGGQAAAAQFSAPTSVAVAGDGTMYIAESYRVRRVAPDGTVMTWVSSPSGPGGINETVISPFVTLDSQDKLYIADRTFNRIFVINQDKSRTFLSENLIKPNGEYDTTGSSNILGLQSPAGLAVDRAGNLFVAEVGNHRIVELTAWRNVASVSAASYDGRAVAAEEIVAAFGTSLASGTEIAPSVPLPTTLAGTTVKIRDSAGVERTAPLFFVSPQQVNYQVPSDTAPGIALVHIISGDTTVSTGTLQVRSTAPGLFTANSTGEGIAAALLLRIRADQSQVYEPVAFFDQAQNRFIARPIDLGNPSDQVYLILFGTGLRGRDQKIPVTASFGDEDLEVLYAGPQGGFIGLDQVNVRLPRSLAGRGETELKLTIDQQTTNTVKVSFAGTPCASTINPAAQNVSAAGGTFSVSISGACAWLAFSREGWIRINAGSSDTGNDSVSIEVAPNPLPASRTGNIRIAGQTLTVTQNGAGETSPPVITITSPTAAGTYQTGAQAITLKGTASSSSGIAVLAWSNDRGGSGLLSGATEWTIEGVALQPGLNLITVVAYDNKGRNGSAKLAVTQALEFKIITIAGGGTSRPGDGRRATEAELFPSALATDQQGNLYIAGDNRIRKVTPDGIITTIVGGGTSQPGSNAPALGAQIGDVRSMVIDQNGDLYFSSRSVGRVWKLPAGAANLTLLAGAGSGSDGGPAYSARIYQPDGLALDGQGNLYVAENVKIRKINLATNIISTVAGGNILPSGNGDGGPATAASVSIPDSLATDSAGNIYFSEYYSKRVRRIDARTGIITTVIGGGALPSADGSPGTSIQLNYPAGIAFDSNDNLYVTVALDHRILRFDSRTGTITTVAGNGAQGFSGDGGAAINAQFNNPGEVAIDRAGRIYIGDWNNKRVRQLIPF